MYRGRRERRASGATVPRIRRPGSPAIRIGSSGNSDKSRRSPDSAYFRFLGERAQFRRGLFRNVRKSAKTRRERGEWPQNQAARIDGQSLRICRKYRAIPAIAGFGARAHSRRKGANRRGASEMPEIRRKRGSIGANVPRIRRRGPTAIRIGCVPRLRRFRWSERFCFAIGVCFGRPAAAFR